MRGSDVTDRIYEEMNIMTKFKIGGCEVSKDAVWIYIQHFGRDKTDIHAWEKMRKYLHDYIFEGMNLDRNSDEGIRFGKALDRWAEPHILKYDSISATAKRLSNAEDDKDIEIATVRLRLEMEKADYRARNGFRDMQVTDRNVCRICNKELVGGIPRLNDHLAMVIGFDKIDAPICLTCSKEKPDEYHKEFKRQYHQEG